MARRDQHTIEREVAALRRDFAGPRLTLVTTHIVPVEVNDVPGRQCPITGSETVWALEEIDDLSFMIENETGDRTNRWTLGKDDACEYDDLASEAVHYQDAADEEATFWHVPIVWMCPDDHVEDLLDDETPSIFWSGGWRSGKTYRALQWWQRGWAKYGRHSERFWLLGPEVVNAWRLFQKLFWGEDEVPPLFPSLEPGRPSFMLTEAPLRRTARDLTFKLPDNSIGEMYHLKGQASNVEGESVRRVLIDEACSMKTAKGYDVSKGRVMQRRGQVGLASVADEDCVWLYEKCVAEYIRIGAHMPRRLTKFETERPITRTRTEPGAIKCRFVSGYDNPWMPDDAVDRMIATETDPVVIDNKYRGIWTRRGLYAYGDVWSESDQTRDELSHSAAAWGLGPDITAAVIRKTFQLKHAGTAYLGGVDFSGGGDKPQTRLWFKLFGDLVDWHSWNLVIMDEESTQSDAKQASQESRRRGNGGGKDDGRYAGSYMVGDCNGFHKANDEGGRERKSNDAQHYKLAGFQMRAPIANVKAGQLPTYSNPGVGDSRTVVRDLMRRGKLWANQGKCPGSANMMHKAPNRRKLNRDKNSWIEKQIYGYEDALRYVVWRVFSRLMERRDLKAMKDAESKASEGRAA